MGLHAQFSTSPCLRAGAGVTVSGATQITAAGALPLTVMDWADVEHRNDTCDVVRRCALVSEMLYKRKTLI
jgi:hypothetical protein